MLATRGELLSSIVCFWPVVNALFEDALAFVVRTLHTQAQGFSAVDVEDTEPTGGYMTVPQRGTA